MKLCVTSTGTDIHSMVDDRFGRAHFFLMVDTDTMKYEAVYNSARDEGQEAGVRAVGIVSDKGAGALLTGVVGPNAFAALKEAGISVFEGASEFDSVKAAVEKFKEGRYREAAGPSGAPGRGQTGD
jgi:predicted Fe-Mo cluster-binding NifX family protein